MFLYFNTPILGAGFLMLSFFKLKKFFKHPFRRIIGNIKHDADQVNVVIPENEDIQERLINLYIKFDRVAKTYPMMSEEIKDIKKNFWNQLAFNFDLKAWEDSLYKLEGLRIFPTIENSNQLDLSLNRLKNSFEFLKEAQLESVLESKIEMPINKHK